MGQADCCNDAMIVVALLALVAMAESHAISPTNATIGFSLQGFVACLYACASLRWQLAALCMFGAVVMIRKTL